MHKIVNDIKLKSLIPTKQGQIEIMINTLYNMKHTSLSVIILKIKLSKSQHETEKQCKKLSSLRF